MNDNIQDSKEAIDKLTNQFFNVFTNTDNTVPDLDKIKTLFIPDGIIINNTSASAQVYNLNSFIQPRKELLVNGALSDFQERETSSKTEIIRNIAYRVSHYEKSGKLNSTSFDKTGVKFMQFIKINGQWKISAVVWDDE